MRRLTCSLALSLLLPMTAAPAAEIPPTPNDSDIPRPVPVSIDLAGSDKPDIGRFLNVRSAFSPSLSPDGTQLAFRTSITGKPQLWVVDADGGWPHQLTFGESVTFNAWSPGGEWILYGSDRGGNEREGYYLISADGARERELLAPSEAFRVFGAFSPDGRKVAYSSTQRNGRDFDVYVLDLATGSETLVYEGLFGFFVEDWSPDGSKLVLSETRGEDANDLHLLDLETGAARTLFEPDTAAAYSDISWRPDGSGFYLATDQDREFSGLASYDLDAGTLEFVATPEHDVGNVTLSRDGRYLTWTANEGGYSALHVRNLATGADVAVPELPAGVYTLDWAHDAPVASLNVRGPQVPGDLWTWNLASGELHRATESSLAGLDPARLVVPRHFDFPARDGETLHGLLYLPPGLAQGEKAPVLLGVHGGPTAQSRPLFSPSTQYLAAQGVAVFDLNFRGSTGYGKRFARLDNQRLRPNAVLDMEDAIHWLGTEGLVDTTRSAVMGGSYGGYMAFAAVTTFPDLFDVAVSFVGVSNWITALEGASPALKASDRVEYGDINDPADREFFRQLSPITHIDRVKTPIMVLHGANDPRDPVSESDQFVRGVRERGGTVEYLRFPDEGHGIRRLENRLIAYRRIAQLLRRELGMEEESTVPIVEGNEGTPPRGAN
jgi:dipeptidyl aminopeptidase/acylaminoacyl peptidase